GGAEEAPGGGGGGGGLRFIRSLSRCCFSPARKQRLRAPPGRLEGRPSSCGGLSEEPRHRKTRSRRRWVPGEGYSGKGSEEHPESTCRRPNVRNPSEPGYERAAATRQFQSGPGLPEKPGRHGF